MSDRKTLRPAHPLVGQRGKCPACEADIVISRGNVIERNNDDGSTRTVTDNMLLHEPPFCSWFERTDTDEIIRLMIGAKLVR